MRFIELRPDPEREGFSLHPRITVLGGLNAAARVELVGFAHSIATGEDFGWGGTVEIHGVHMQIDRAIDLVGSIADSALIVEARALVDIAAEPGTIGECEVEAYREAVVASEAIDVDIAALAEELNAASALRSEMGARLAAARARIEPDAGRRLDLADGNLGRAARAAGRPDPWTGANAVPERYASLEVLLETIDEQLEALPSGDRPVLAAALASARAALSTGPVVLPEAAALAEAWMSLHQRLVGLESRMEAAGGGTEAVAARLEAARAAARAAEDAAVPLEVRAEQSDQLEALHERVIDMEGRVGRSIRRNTARREFEEARAALNAALDEIGYPTWAAFRMGNGLASVAADRVVEYDRTRAEWDAAETEWAELMARLERDTDLQTVLDAIDSALDQAIEILGADPYEGLDSEDPEILADSLRHHEVDAGTVGVESTDALAHLRSVLDACGSVGHQDLTSDIGLIALADTWLHVLGSADAAAVRILRDRERAAAELEELILLGSGSRRDRLDAERAAMYEAEEVVATNRESLIEINRTQLELHMLAATELAVAEEHDAKLELRDGAKVLERLAEHRMNKVTGGPCGIEAVAARLPRGKAGTVPLVVLMGDAEASALDGLSELPEDVQIIVVGDTPGLAEWVADQPYGTAKLARVHASA